MQKLIYSLLISIAFCEPSCEASFFKEFEGAYYSHYNERLEIIAKFLPEDPIIFEAGGHYGIDTIRFAKRWPKSQIITFEPNPHAFEIFSLATQGLSQVHGHNLAVNNYNGEATLYVCYGSTGNDPRFEGASSLLKASEYMEKNYQGPKVKVPCVVLDDWCKKNQIDQIDFMWLDLEGLELQVLKSSPTILDTVNVIYTETNFQPFRVGMTQYKDLKEFLEQKRFKLVSHWYAENFQGNAIFVKKEPFEN